MSRLMLAGLIEANHIYLEILTFGAAPVLTWLAHQFPDVGANLRILEPGLQGPSNFHVIFLSME